MYRRVVWLADGGEVLQKRIKLKREMQNIVDGFKEGALGLINYSLYVHMRLDNLRKGKVPDRSYRYTNTSVLKILVLFKFFQII